MRLARILVYLLEHFLDRVDVMLEVLAKLVYCIPFNVNSCRVFPFCACVQGSGLHVNN